MDFMWIFWNLLSVILGVLLAWVIWGPRVDRIIAENKLMKAGLIKPEPSAVDGITVPDLGIPQVGQIVMMDDRPFQLQMIESEYAIDYDQDRVRLTLASSRSHHLKGV